jgi:methylphosphotriester-DNA--protein-cysteine methyltransferase
LEPADEAQESFFWVGYKRKKLIHDPGCKKIPWYEAPLLALYTSLVDAFRDGYRPCRACIDEERAAPAMEEAKRLGIEDKIGRPHIRKRYQLALERQKKRIEKVIQEARDEEGDEFDIPGNFNSSSSAD